MMNTCDNPDLPNYFDKNFAEYKKGFESKGKNYSSHLPSHRSLIFWGLCEYLVNTFKLKVSTMYWEFWNQANPPIWDFHTHTRANKFWNIELISGEVWLGLEALHKLTSVGSYSLHILMKDFDQKTYVAIYDQFKVIMILMVVINPDNNAGWSRRWLCVDSGRVQQSSLHPWRLSDPQWRWKC